MGRVEPVTWLGNVTLFLQPDPAGHMDPWRHGVVRCGGWGGVGVVCKFTPDVLDLKNKVS